ncbi:AAA family ATPase [Flavobacterium sp. LS1R49]|uniref:AAA family ATPase n=1 Tax=Flavobacterium shii TaxID=2987687 RepID=A0A9X2YXI8_9FLAO|nr:AAA family ATPase [Flavobacterium shii]MCV9930019.1 AAA family ATPase [Flavobacterium shii]
MKPIDLSEYFKTIKQNSKFEATLAKRGGYVTFGNTSGKSFTLGLDSVISIVKDILANLDKFKNNSNYDEKKWRDLSAANFKDSAANAMATVQTKPLFTTISKLICWSNNYDVSKYSDNKINLNKESLKKTIHELELLAELYTPKQKPIDEINTTETSAIVVSEKDLKQFAFSAFKFLLNQFGSNEILKNTIEKNSQINETEYVGLKMKPYFGSGNLIGSFDQEQTRESLSSGNQNTQRFFPENLNLQDYPYSYFSTQWGDVDNGNLSFNNFKNFVADFSKGSFEAKKQDDKYSLFQKTKLNRNILQKIYYGAPGTGKSHKIENILKNYLDDEKERITFHPEYDYSCFVGGYRPTSEVNEENGKLEITYKFVPQVFTNIYVKAWKNQSKDYFLAIEEINRGNCAEIFGDLFQLLDRKSDYSISPSKELKEHLELLLVGTKGIEGGKMRLPSNLHILASMNTSDQSLFPMDSAFKRRWDWEYIPINDKEFNDDATETSEATKNNSYDYIVKIDDNLSFKWIDFIINVNKKITFNRNLGSDKCIGNYFIKPDNIEISLDEFINKAIFYLWIDVFKDEDESIFSLIERNISYENFFPINSNGKDNLIKLLSPKILNIEITDKRKKNENTEEPIE